MTAGAAVPPSPIANRQSPVASRQSPIAIRHSPFANRAVIEIRSPISAFYFHVITGTVALYLNGPVWKYVSNGTTLLYE